MITASIVLYNNDPKIFNRVLISLLNCKAIYKIYIFDNSENSLFDKIEKSEKILYYHSEINIGFGRGHNHSILNSDNQSKYHLIVNPDVEFECDTINALRDTLENHREIVAIMPRVKNMDGSDQNLCKKIPSMLNLVARRFMPEPLGRFLQRGYVLPYKNELFLTPTISGCFMMFRTSKLIEINGFDPQFFMYMEDVDLCRRLWSVGEVACLPVVGILHGYAAGSYRSVRLLGYHIRSAIFYFRKWGFFFDPERELINNLAGGAIPSHLDAALVSEHPELH